MHNVQCLYIHWLLFHMRNETCISYLGSTFLRFENTILFAFLELVFGFFFSLFSSSNNLDADGFFCVRFLRLTCLYFRYQKCFVSNVTFYGQFYHKLRKNDNSLPEIVFTIAAVVIAYNGNKHICKWSHAHGKGHISAL